MSKEQDLQLVDMVNSTNPIYNNFFHQIKWLDSFVVKNSESGSSYKFQELDEDKEGTKNVNDIPLNIINRVFGINIDSSLYRQAVSGDGLEYRRITTLHSSSLAALLLFHSVSEERPIKIGGYTFNEVRFEQKTTVEGSHKSNMDVVLLNKDIVMFLECKFSEYLCSGKYSHISQVYYDTYQDLHLFDGLGDMIAQNMPDNDQSEIELIQRKNYQYCAGIKQMVSHYMGIRNFINDGFNSKDMSLGFLPKKVLLAEILFALPENVDAKNRRQKYEEAYKLIAERINADSKKPDIFEMLPNSFTYQDVFKSYDLSPKIKEFYML